MEPSAIGPLQACDLVTATELSDEVTSASFPKMIIFLVHNTDIYRYNAASKPAAATDRNKFWSRSIVTVPSWRLFLSIN